MCSLQLRAYCGSLSQDKQAERTAVLIAQLADWAVGARQVHAVIRLPLSGLEEQVRVCEAYVVYLLCLTVSALSIAFLGCLVLLCPCVSGRGCLVVHLHDVMASASVVQRGQV